MNRFYKNKLIMKIKFMKYYINNKNYLIIIYNNYQMIKLNNEFIKRNKRKKVLGVFFWIIIFIKLYKGWF